MDLINNFLNIVALPATFFTLLMLVPLFLFFKFLLSTLKSIFFSENVAGKVVLITGASSGIGENLAYQYAKQGAFLVLVARRKNSLQEVAERAYQYGSPDVLVIHADVAKIDDCRRMVEEAVNHFGRLDHLVLSAGIVSVCLFEDAPNVDNFQQVMDTDFWGAIYPTYFAIPHLRKSRGKIVVIASSAGYFPVPRMSFYCASKGAVINFYESLRVELGPDVKITIVTPGLIESEMTKGKFLVKEKKLEVDQELRDVEIGPTPVAYVEDCVKAILNSVRRGDKYITVPAWFKVLYYWRFFCPEILEWLDRVILLTGPSGPSERDTWSKIILDLTGAKFFLYPPSIRSPEIKAD